MASCKNDFLCTLTLAIIPWHSFAASNSEGKNSFFARSFSVCSIFPPRTNICIEYSSTSVTCIKFRDLVRKWHHNSDDSTDIIFRQILSVLYFSLISSCVIHHLLWHLFFAAQFQGQIICFHYKVWICWCTSVFFSKHLVELSPISSVTVGQIVKTKVRVNLKCHKIIIIFYLVQ